MSYWRGARLLHFGFWTLIFGVVFVLSPQSLPALESLSESEMSSVTGREGLTVDVDLDLLMNSIVLTDGDGAACCSGSANSTFQVGSGTNGIIIDDGSGGQADLNGITVDVDGTGGVVVGGPSGIFDVEVDEFQFGGNSGFNQGVRGVDVSNTNISVNDN